MKQWLEWLLKKLLVAGLMVVLLLILTACPPAITVTVTASSPVDRAPQLSLLSLISPANGSLEQNSGSVSGSANFALSDPDDLVTSLAVSASSSNEVIVTNGSLSTQCAGNGNCTLSFLMSTGSAGSTTITVRVTDSAGNSTEQTFNLKVTAPSTSAAVNLCATDGLESDDFILACHLRYDAGAT